MKKLNFLFIFSTFSLIYSQNQLQTLTENTWYLRSYDDGSEYGFYDFSDNPEFDEIVLNFHEEDGVLFYSSTVCSTISGMIEELNEDEMIIGSGTISGDSCTDPETNGFESAYFTHIFGENFYFFYLNENEDGTLSLSLSSQSFCYANFSNQTLSTNQIASSHLQIYPNPFLKIVKIENLKNESLIKIYDKSGKLIFQKSPKENSLEINLQSIPSGIYYISIESEGNIYKKEKIIKK